MSICANTHSALSEATLVLAIPNCYCATLTYLGPCYNILYITSKLLLTNLLIESQLTATRPSVRNVDRFATAINGYLARVRSPKQPSDNLQIELMETPNGADYEPPALEASVANDTNDATIK